MAEMAPHFFPGDALIVVDVQNDFLPGGSLPVERGDEVVPILNRWLDAAAARGVPVFATRDWHPLNHCSFRHLSDRRAQRFQQRHALTAHRRIHRNTTFAVGKSLDPRECLGSQHG